MAASKGVSTSICVLCFEPLLNATDLNLVDGKCKVNAELEDLPFVVYRSSPYICKKCLAALKKRKNLKENLHKTNEQLTLLYRQKCEEYGFSIKRRDAGSVVPRKLRFLNNTSDIDKEAMPRSIQVQDDEIHQEILQDLQENQYISRYFFLVKLFNFRAF
jgi:hypothetical protein